MEAAGGVDSVALTHMDRADEVAQVCTGYDLHSRPQDGPFITGMLPPQVEGERNYQQRLGEMIATAVPILEEMPDPIAEVEEATGAPVTIVAAGPKAEDKVSRQTSEMVA